MENAEKLASLQAALKHFSFDAYIIPLSDPHLGENVPGHWQIVKWLTGFTGSAATLIVTNSFAGLWTDSRYFIQAERELAGTGFELLKSSSHEKNGFTGWLSEKLAPGSKAGFDGRLVSIQLLRKLRDKLNLKDVTLVHNRDLVSGLWQDRPVIGTAQVFEHPVEFAGIGRSEKIKGVREQMKTMGFSHQLLTSPDDIMWMLNIRGNDYAFSPLLSSFAIVGYDQVLLFADESRFPVHIQAAFDQAGVVILPYEEITTVLHKLPKISTLLLDPGTTSVSLFHSIASGVRIIEDVSIPSKMKAVKNKTEIANISKVMVKDGVALTRFFFWIETNHGIIPMSEQSLSRKLRDFRSQQEGFLGLSFPAIVAYNDHAAIPHFSPGEGSDHIISDKGILLVDSGGHYKGGTTDITRTIALGAPNERQKKDFTLVLKGHICLATAVFPYGTRGYQLDILARKALWESGLNYGHGTGHGVGYCLNVHEGPQNISPSDNRTIIEPGMLTSNEPALYREGEYGIRTENLLLTYEDQETEFGSFLKFDTVSLCYIDKLLIDKTLLEKNEREWINSYHAEVFERLSPFLNNDEKKWLWEKTTEL